MNRIQRKRVIKKHARRRRAQRRVRNRIRGSAQKPRLCVYKSLRYIYAQVVDDQEGATLAQASSLEKDLRQALDGSCSNRGAAAVVGAKVAERAMEKGIRQVVFDRSGYIYHGKVQALAESAREKGLEF